MMLAEAVHLVLVVDAACFPYGNLPLGTTAGQVTCVLRGASLHAACVVSRM